MTKKSKNIVTAQDIRDGRASMLNQLKEARVPELKAQAIVARATRRYISGESSVNN